MTKGMVKCGKCGKQIYATEATLISKIKYCPECAEIRKKEVEINKKLNDLLYALCDKNDDIMPFLTTQVKRMKDEYKYTAKGILATLKYVFLLPEDPPDFRPEMGIEGLVIRNYYAAHKYYDQVRKLTRQPIEDIDDALKTPTKEIHLNQGVLSFKQDLFLQRRKDKEYGPEIDLNDIDDEDEEEIEENADNEKI